MRQNTLSDHVPCTSASELFGRAGIAVPNPASLNGIEITDVTDDSRALCRDACFVAVRGVGSDGHRFVPDAVCAGARIVVSEEDLALPSGVLGIRVTDTRSAIARLAAAFYRVDGMSLASPILTGITGTNGKTTVAWLIRSILKTAGYVPAMFGTVEYDLVSERRVASLTTPGPVELCRHLSKAREAGATHAVMEVSSHALDQQRVDGLSFKVGVFTNLTGDHLDYHGSMEVYAKAKRRLFELLDGNSVAVVNADDPHGRFMVKNTRASIVTYGVETPGADVQAASYKADRQSTCFDMLGPWGRAPIRSTLLGKHNVLNALSASAAAWALGVSAEDICTGLQTVSGVPGRLQRVEPDGFPFSVLVDYAHTDDALKNVLSAVRPLTLGRVICVFGCGGDRDRTKRPRMAAVVGGMADVAIVTSDNPRSEDPQAIMDEILAGFMSQARCRVESRVDRRSAIRMAVEEARSGDTVLIAGKGHENYQLVGNQVLPFDDVDVARECLVGLTNDRGGR
ncbi:MAG: UDP-N-acetylmuramoyl-L-alanyl-D-glutamate--2,6-diaminopimelate ligase [Planctomycetota bacterium]